MSNETNNEFGLGSIGGDLLAWALRDDHNDPQEEVAPQGQGQADQESDLVGVIESTM